MSNSPHRQIVDAIDRLRSGVDTLTSAQYLRLLDAVEHVSTALQLAPRGSDPVATGVWYHHERGVALAKLADALRLERRGEAGAGGQHGTHDPTTGAAASAEAAHTDERHHNAAVIRALQESIQSI